jgi:hypothetical protein
LFFCDVGDRIVPEAEISLAIPEPEEEIDHAVSYLLREGAISSVKPGFFRMASDSDSDSDKGKTNVKNLNLNLKHTQKKNRRTTKMNKDKDKNENKDEHSSKINDFVESGSDNGMGKDKERKEAPQEKQEKLERDSDGIYDLTENDVGADISGERVDIEDVIGKNIVIEDMVTRPSTFHDGNYAVIQLSGDRILMTSSSILIDQIRDLHDKLPIRCQIAEHKSVKNNRKYYSLSKALM